MTQTNHKHKKHVQHKAHKSKVITLNKRLVIIGSLVALLIINGLLVAAFMKMSYLRAQSNSIVLVNQSKTLNGITIKVNDVKPETGYTMGIIPGADSKLISFHISVSNNSGSDYAFYPSIQTFIRNNEGQNYIMTPVKLDSPFEATTIKPSETKSGRLSYKVTNRAVPLFLYIESRQADAGPFVVKLQ